MAITGWCAVLSLLFCVIAKSMNVLRLSEEDELLGGDLHYFGPLEFDGSLNDLKTMLGERLSRDAEKGEIEMYATSKLNE